MTKDTWRVFSQDSEPRMQGQAWQRAAERFFGTKLEVSAATLSVDGVPRNIVGRLREEGDLRDALVAEGLQGFTRLYDLAERRCPTVWLIEREGPADRAALLIAAILASVCLGPILGDDSGLRLFGVRTAREKLESRPWQETT